MIVLAVDIGNSQTKLGFFEGDKLTARECIPADSGRSDRMYSMLVRAVIAKHSDGSRLAEVIACASAPSAIAGFLLALGSQSAERLVVLRKASEFGIGIAYDVPEDVGRDRLANALAARTLYGSPIIVVDLGTATTFDIVDSNGIFVGGAIAPGLGTSADSLLENAAHLPKIDLTAPAEAIARSTVQALQSGMVFGHAAMVDGMVDRMAAELGGERIVVATGGWAHTIAPLSRAIQITDENLTLHGIRLAWELSRGEKSE